MQSLVTLYRSEPAVINAAVAAVIAAVIDLAIAFGLQVTGDQKITIMGVVTVLLQLIAGVVTRGQVTPVAKPQSPTTTLSG